MNRFLLSILTSVLLPLSLAAAVTRSTYTPDFESGSINLRIAAVHLSDSATIIDTDIYFKPTQNIEQLGLYLSKAAKLHLKGNLTDSAYPLRYIVGTPFEIDNPEADSTHVSATFAFPPLAPADSVFDFVDRLGQYTVRAITPASQPHGILTPITGEVSNYPENSWVYIMPQEGDLRFSKAVIVPVRDGKFSYDLYTDVPRAYQIIFGPEGLRHAYKTCYFIADGQPVAAGLDSNRPFWETVKGSPLNDSYIGYYANMQTAIDNSGIKARNDSLQALIDNTRVQFLENDTTLAGLAIIYHSATLDRRAIHERDFEIFRKKHSVRFPAHPYTIALNQILAGEAAGQTAEKGGRYYDFSAPDINGTVHRLSDMIKGRYAVIDLWASWCGPCRRHSIELIPIYEKWKGRGFTVVGVAREYGDTKAMERCIRQDGYPWLNLVAFGDNAIDIWSRYKAANSGGRILLVDPSGEILAVQPTAAGIDAILESVIGEK